MLSHRLRMIGLMLGALLLAGGASAWAVEAGITLDVHQDVFPPQLWPNDFHIEGVVCSHNSTPPVVINHIDGPFLHFTYTITKVTGDECNYWFEATWWNDPNTGYIPYCTVIHLGVLFDVDASNIVINTVGWWTRDGQPVGGMFRTLTNMGYVPVIGFDVQDTAMPQKITIGNGQLESRPPLPRPVPTPPWPPAPIPLYVQQMDVVAFPPGAAPPFEELYEGGAQMHWPWVPVVYANGEPISPLRPYYFVPDSFFDVFLDMPGRTDTFRTQTPAPIPVGGFLVARQLIGFVNNNGQQESRWFWEVHGAQQPEACCFTDGHCEDLLPFTCLQRGGQPMGLNTVCMLITCPQVQQGACCYGTVAPQCVVTDAATCQQQYAGQWKGPGTTCADLDGDGVADICEPAVVGACCYGGTTILCVVTTEVLCNQQYLGVWKGAGTNCDDLDGDNIADICEPPPLPEACCLPNGTCLMIPPADCLAMGGTPKGLGSRCLGDLNGNGIDDICEAKWYQMPDLHETGIDVKATAPNVLADDFVCTQRSLVTDIIVWGSWRGDQFPGGDPGNVRFTLSIHANMPGIPYSQPGPTLWVRRFAPGTFTTTIFQAQILEGWWDPATPGSYIFPGDTMCVQYTFRVPPGAAFCQKGTATAPVIYWLDVQAEPIGPVAAEFGWKTSLDHRNSPAVWGQGVEPYLGPWAPLLYPQQTGVIDLAFAIGGNMRCLCAGDMNCDGSVTFADIDPFVEALAGESSWNLHHPNCPWLNADCNGDGNVTFADIDPFVALIGTTCP